MTDSEFLKWLEKQKHIDFMLYGVPNPKKPGKMLYLTEVEINGDDETVTLPIPHTQGEKDKSYVNIFKILTVLNRIAKEQGIDNFFDWSMTDKDGGIDRAFKEYTEVFYGASET
ncbi:MAG: hypothetical protein LIO60_04500 [Oscillospiraceae bacterium]|nr:hypothetical protein [Oscillospiraceae bacterium]